MSEKYTELKYTELKLNKMVEKAIKELNAEIAKADHPILKLITITRHEGYGIALKELGVDTEKLGILIEIEARKIEPYIRSLLK